MSLSTWFRDYLYIPLGGSRGGTWMKVRNTFIIFLVSGFWHGANWTFIAWGGLNALYFLPLLLLKRNRTNLGVVAEGRKLPSLRELWQMGTTFLLAVLAWVFFRAESLPGAIGYLNGIFSKSIIQIPDFHGRTFALYTLLVIIIQLIIEWNSKSKVHALFGLKDQSYSVRILSYSMLIYLIFAFGQKESSEFIYFQF